MSRKVFHTVNRGPHPPMDLTSMADLNLMIRQGYGDVPQWQMPENWRTVKREDQETWRCKHSFDVPAEMLPKRGGGE